MNSVAFVLLLATGLTAVSAGINDIVNVHDGNANEYADEVNKTSEKYGNDMHFFFIRTQFIRVLSFKSSKIQEHVKNIGISLKI